MSKAIKSYTDLRVYQLAFKAAMRIFKLSKTWPPEERYSLTDQIRIGGMLSKMMDNPEAWCKQYIKS